MMRENKKCNDAPNSAGRMSGRARGAAHRRVSRLRRGLSLIWTAVLIIVFLGFTGLGIDMGYVFLAAHQLQNAADAAALAAARFAREEDQTLVPLNAVEIAGANFAANQPVVLEVDIATWTNDPNGDVVLGLYDRDPDEGEEAFTALPLDSETVPNAVLVRARRTEDSPGGQVPLFFGSFFGVEGVNIERTAIAMIGGGTGEGLIALGTCICGLDINGNVCLTVNDGDLQINSQGGGQGPDAGCGVCTDGSSYSIQAGQINTDGGEVCADLFDGIVDTEAGAVPDPLAFLEPPPAQPIVLMENCNVVTNADCDSSTRVTILQGHGPVTLNPGYYPEGIEIQPNAEAYMNPGIYIIGRPDGNIPVNQFPAGLTVGGSLTGQEVMLYIEATPDHGPNVNCNSCSDPNVVPPCYPGASVNILAGANVFLTPPPEGDYYEHVVFFQARNNVRRARINGGPGLQIHGTLYFPANEVLLVGTGEGQFGNQFIAHQMSLSGNGCIEINYTGTFVAAGSTVFLVR